MSKRKRGDDEQAAAAPAGASGDAPPLRAALPFALPSPVYLTLGRDDVDKALSRLGFESCRALGLDVEARPTFRRSGGSNPVDTIQLCSDQACAVVSLGRAARLPPLLSRLVASVRRHRRLPAHPWAREPLCTLPA